MAEFHRKKRKICQMCAGKQVSYKDDSVKKYVSLDKGKILPRRLTGTSLKYQRKVSVAVKRARHLALMPYVADLLK